MCSRISVSLVVVNVWPRSCSSVRRCSVTFLPPMSMRWVPAATEYPSTTGTACTTPCPTSTTRPVVLPTPYRARFAMPATNRAGTRSVSKKCFATRSRLCRGFRGGSHRRTACRSGSARRALCRAWCHTSSMSSHWTIRPFSTGYDSTSTPRFCIASSATYTSFKSLAPPMTCMCFGRPTIVGNTSRGVLSPPYPILHRYVPASMTTAALSPSSHSPFSPTLLALSSFSIASSAPRAAPTPRAAAATPTAATPPTPAAPIDASLGTASAPPLPVYVGVGGGYCENSVVAPVVELVGG
mmetsp:Transcript_31143/g.87309  ORF Transcript_31143/g.87309 Transcript_31143/m.87309 type:complete len:297 (+) Transcript_31143:504-1394(+)